MYNLILEKTGKALTCLILGFTIISLPHVVLESAAQIPNLETSTNSIVHEVAAASAAPIVINELDADTPGSDALEFIELYNMGSEAVDLSDYVLVLFNGNGDVSYRAFDLDGFSMAPEGYLLLGNDGVSGTSITFPGNTLQNGADAVALYTGSSADFPNGTEPSTINLIDAIVYGTADPDDTELLAALSETTQYDEASNGDKDNHSIQRSPDGSETIIVASPTPIGAAAGEPTVSFAVTEASATEGSSVSIDITIENKPDTDVVVDVMLLDSLSADASDLDGYVTQTVTFAGDTEETVKSVSFTVTNDDLLEPLEGAVLGLQNTQGGVAGDDTFVLLIEPSDVSVATQTVLFAGVSGEALLDSLRAHYSPIQTLGYDRGRDTLYAAVEAVDGYVVDVYTGKIAGLTAGADPSTTLFQQGLNAEHVFPQSMGMGIEPQRSDMHNLFPADADANSLRSNNPYAEITDASASSWLYRGLRYDVPLSTTSEALYSEYVSGQFEPKESFKGDGARAMMYAATIWANVAVPTFFDPQKDLLVAWHYEDPVDSLEHRRTRRIADYQGNVNPFVVDSTLARRAFLDESDGGFKTVAYWFDGNDECPTTDDGPSESPDEAAFNKFMRVGVECNNASGVFNSTEWPGSRSANHYVEFYGNAPMDAAFAFTSGTAISFTARRSGTGPTEGELMYQAEGSDFKSLGTWTLAETDEQEMSFRLAEIDQSWNVRFRLYAWGATSDRGTLRFDDVQVSFGIVGTDVEHESELPAAFALLPAYPNPFNPATTIQIAVNTSQHLRIEVIDALGRQVAVIADQHFPAGRRAIRFDAAHLASGLYLIRAIGEEGVSMQRAILMK